MTNFKALFLAGAILFCTVFFVAPSGALEIQGLPGSVWGQTTYDNDGLTGSGFMGFMNQGVHWLTLPGETKLVTFAEYRLRTRAHNKTYYDTRGSALGVELRKSIFSLGAAYYWEYFPGLRTTSKNREVYLYWFYDWDLKPKDKDLFLGIKGLPGSNWASLTYDINGLNGSGAQGFINQGIDWFKLPGDVMVNTFVEYRFKTRTQNTTYYNTSGTAVGLDFKKSVFHFGVNYYWEKLPELKQTSNRAQLYVYWFHSWDLKDYFKH